MHLGGRRVGAHLLPKVSLIVLFCRILHDLPIGIQTRRTSETSSAHKLEPIQQVSRSRYSTTILLVPSVLLQHTAQMPKHLPDFLGDPTCIITSATLKPLSCGKQMSFAGIDKTTVHIAYSNIKSCKHDELSDTWTMMDISLSREGED